MEDNHLQLIPQANDGDKSSLPLNLLQAENDKLREKLEEIRRKRHFINSQRERQEIIRNELEDRLNTATNRQYETLLDFQSAVCEREKVQSALNTCQQLKVINDCFHIWHEGPFATINGLRLGLEAPPPCDTASPALNATTVPNTNIAETKRYNYFSGSFSHVDNQSNKSTNYISEKVPWKETNAALGQVALLLATIERKSFCGIKFRYEIVPAGSTSKIGMRQSLGSSLTLYNLYYSDENFQFFGKRNFNTAIQYLVQCVADTAEGIRQRDRTIILPHCIEKRAGNSELTIGGIPIFYGVDDIEWTRAMKYLLTNIKYIMIFKPLGL